MLLLPIYYFLKRSLVACLKGLFDGFTEVCILMKIWFAISRCFLGGGGYSPYFGGCTAISSQQGNSGDGNSDANHLDGGGAGGVGGNPSAK